MRLGSIDEAPLLVVPSDVEGSSLIGEGEAMMRFSRLTGLQPQAERLRNQIAELAQDEFSPEIKRLEPQLAAPKKINSRCCHASIQVTSDFMYANAMYANAGAYTNARLLRQQFTQLLIGSAGQPHSKPSGEK